MRNRIFRRTILLATLALAIVLSIRTVGDRKLYAYYLWHTDPNRLTTCVADFERLKPNRRDRSGITPLFAAVFAGNLSAVDSLIDRGADVTARVNPAAGFELRFFGGKSADYEFQPAGWTALHLAAYLGHAEIAQRLLRSGADVNARNDLGQTSIATALTNLDKSTPINCVFADEMVALLVQSGGEIDLADASGRTPLAMAIHDHGSVDLVKQIVAAGARPNFFSAAMTGDVQLVKRLLDSGAYVNVQWPDGNTALHYAAMYRYESLVALLIERGADVNAKETWSDQTPLHNAVLGDNANIVRLLIHAGADVHARTNYFEMTPLHDAARGESAAIVEEILAAGADPNARVGNREPPLYYAMMSGGAKPDRAAVVAALRAAGGKTKDELDMAPSR